MVEAPEQTQAMVECEIYQRLSLFRVEDWKDHVYLRFEWTLEQLTCS